MFCGFQMTQHMAGMNVYNTNSMVGYSSQHMGGSTTPSSVHMTAHIWKWSHFSKKRCNANNPRKRGSCRNQWIRLSLRHFVMQGRRRKRRRRRAKGKPLLPLFLLSAYAFSSRLSPRPCFCVFPCLPSEHFPMMTNTTGFWFSLVRTTHLSSYRAVNSSVCAHTSAVCGCKLLDFLFGEFHSFSDLIRIVKSKWICLA